jgi:hypothetical protein
MHLVLQLVTDCIVCTISQICGGLGSRRLRPWLPQSLSAMTRSRTTEWSDSDHRDEGLNGEDFAEEPGSDNEMYVASTLTAATPGATTGATWHRHHPPTAEELEPLRRNLTSETSPVLTQAAAVDQQQAYGREVIRTRQEKLGVCGTPTGKPRLMQVQSKLLMQHEPTFDM